MRRSKSILGSSLRARRSTATACGVCVEIEGRVTEPCPAVVSAHFDGGFEISTSARFKLWRRARTPPLAGHRTGRGDRRSEGRPARAPCLPWRARAPAMRRGRPPGRRRASGCERPATVPYSRRCRRSRRIDPTRSSETRLRDRQLRRSRCGAIRRARSRPSTRARGHACGADAMLRGCAPAVACSRERRRPRRSDRGASRRPRRRVP